MEQLPAVQCAEHLEQAGDLAAHDGLGPAATGAVQERAQVPMTRVLEHQAVEDPFVGSRQRELVEDLDRARVAVQQLAEVRLAQPAVDVPADLDAHHLRHDSRMSEPRREIDLAETADADQPFDAVLEAGFRARDDLGRHQQRQRPLRRDAGGAPAAGRGG